MAKNNNFIYPTTDEVIGNPSLKLDGDSNKINNIRTSELLSEYTKINKDKILYFLDQMSLDQIFENSSLIGITPEQEILLNEFKELLFMLGGQ